MIPDLPEVFETVSGTMIAMKRREVSEVLAEFNEDAEQWEIEEALIEMEEDAKGKLPDNTPAPIRNFVALQVYNQFPEILRDIAEKREEGGDDQEDS